MALNIKHDNLLFRSFYQVKPKIFYFFFVAATLFLFQIALDKMFFFLQVHFISKVITPSIDLTQIVLIFSHLIFLLGMINFSQEWISNEVADIKKLFVMITNRSEFCRMAPYLSLVTLIMFAMSLMEELFPILKKFNAPSVIFTFSGLFLSLFLNLVLIRIFKEKNSWKSATKEVWNKIPSHVPTFFNLFLSCNLLIIFVFAFYYVVNQLALSREFIDFFGERAIAYFSKGFGALLALNILWLAPVYIHLPYVIYEELFQD